MIIQRADFKPELKPTLALAPVGVFIAIGLWAIISGWADPFPVKLTGCLISAFLCWISGAQYRWFAWSASALILALIFGNFPTEHIPYLSQFFFVSFFLSFIVAIRKLPQYQKPGITWLFALMPIIASLIMLGWATQGGSANAIKGLYTLLNVLLIIVLLPCCEAAYNGQAPPGRFFLILTAILNWLATLLYAFSDELYILVDLRYIHAIWFLADTILGVGVFYDARSIKVRLWPFILGVGGLEVAWVSGIIGLHPKASIFFYSWVIVGALTLFIYAYVITRGFYVGSEHKRQELINWNSALDDFSRDIEREIDTQTALSDLFDKLQALYSSWVGIKLNLDEEHSIAGKTGPYHYNLYADDKCICQIYSNKPDAFNKIIPISEMIANRFSGLVYKLELKNQSHLDSMTRLYNRRGLQHRLPELCRQAQRNHSSCSVLMIDLDRFKKINDTYGHETGDLVIEAAAEIIKNIFRGDDIASRWGGEEFIIIASGATVEQSIIPAERFRQKLARLDLGTSWPITASIGIAGGEIPDNLDDFKLWLKQADQALYEAKNNGRNTTRCFASRS